jgi:hypothetical protein
VEVITIRGECRFAEGATVDVVEDLAGEFSARSLAVVLDRGGREIEAVVSSVRGHNSLCSTARGDFAG